MGISELLTEPKKKKKQEQLISASFVLDTLKEGGEWVFGSTDLASEIARIVDFCVKSSGLADFENTVDHGSALIFGADSRLCLSYVRILGPKRNLDHRSFFSLCRNVTEFVQIISPFERRYCHWNCTVL